MMVTASMKTPLTTNFVLIMVTTSFQIGNAESAR